MSLETRKAKSSRKKGRVLLTVDLFFPFPPLDQLPRRRHQPAGSHHLSASASDHSGNIAASTGHHPTSSCHRRSLRSSWRQYNPVSSPAFLRLLYPRGGFVGNLKLDHHDWNDQSNNNRYRYRHKDWNSNLRNSDWNC